MKTNLIVNEKGPTGRINESRLFIYVSPQVQVIDEVAAYTWINLWAEIGGYVGLCLGYSVYQFLGDIWFIILRILRRIQCIIRPETI